MFDKRINTVFDKMVDESIVIAYKHDDNAPFTDKWIIAIYNPNGNEWDIFSMNKRANLPNGVCMFVETFDNISERENLENMNRVCNMYRGQPNQLQAQKVELQTLPVGIKYQVLKMFDWSAMLAFGKAYHNRED